MPFMDKSTGQSMYLVEGPYSFSFDAMASDERIVALRMAILLIQSVLGEPPSGCRLVIQRIDNEHLADDVIAVMFPPDAPVRTDEKWQEDAEVYALKASKAMDIFAEAIDWNLLRRDHVNSYIQESKLWTEQELLDSLDN